MNLSMTLPEEPATVRELTNVLIVDDVPQNLVAMEALLARDDIRILKAASGPEALELLLVHDVALALLDVQMPDMDGFVLAELMRGSLRTRDVPIIFLTASPNDPARSFKGYETGAVDFLHKPIDPRVILGKVDVFVQLYQQRQQLKAQNSRLERALQLNEAMIAVLTHDLRTPLSAISLCADRIVVETTDGPLARTAHHIETSAKRMARMIDQLLDFSRIRSGSIRLDLASNDLAAVAKAVVEETRQAHPTRAIEMAFEGETAGYFDATRMSQVLSNLLGNAVQYALGSTPILLVVDGSDPATVQISVRNAGVLPANLVQRIFEPFKGSFHQSRGLGLGLYIVDQFVRAHGGTVTAQNVTDGVEFVIDVPRNVVR
ncbi:response regulator [Luteibacter pinisoli]|uniref:histidine kinase n=1 Tax=Luteibacter pinisoli TaxID=2589080 RepID=A0A4Y5Z5T8_9GAMM|nr:hybrid sensor histidine kinase/response regulator [Luteibacter pinisoli]QDE39628.1 response regulator [Luteibacter pinisoli]